MSPAQWGLSMSWRGPPCPPFPSASQGSIVTGEAEIAGALPAAPAAPQPEPLRDGGQRQGALLPEYSAIFRQ